MSTVLSGRSRRMAASAGLCVVMVAGGVAPAYAGGAWAAGGEGADSRLVGLDLVDRLVMEPVDRAKLLAEDASLAGAGVAPRFAVAHPVRESPETAGTWENLDAETLIWRLRVASAGAESLNFGFTGFWLPVGAELRVYASDDSWALPAFTWEDNESHGELWTPVIPTDEAVIELTVPSKLLGSVVLELGSVNLGYKPFGPALKDAARAAKSGSCNVDVRCPEGDDWRDEIASVGVISTGGGTFCTGFMVNNTANDRTPYFMTANHCGIGPGNAPSLVVYWNYEFDGCRAPGSGPSGAPGGPLPNQFNTGSTFVASSSASDFTLVLLDDDPDPDWEVSFAGWDNSGDEATTAVAIHHPSTDEKRISFEFDPTTTTSYLSDTPSPTGTHVRVEDWDIGTTEPGSSGSPVFDQNNRVIGQLHGGFAACGNDDPDWYGRVSVSWDGGSPTTRLRDWLDPAGTGATALDTLPSRGLSVTPGSDVTHRGVLGGPFTNGTTVYTLSNTTPDPVSYEVSLAAGGTAPLELDGGTSAVSGTLLQGETRDVTVTLSSAANALPAGVYATTVMFTDTSAGVERSVTHRLEAGLTGFVVAPAEDHFGSGPEGGPYGPSKTYRVTSTQPTAVMVRVESSDSWITLDGGAGPVEFELAGEGAFRDIEVDFGPDAGGLGTGIFTGQVSFANVSGGEGGFAAEVTLDAGRIAAPSQDTPIAIGDNSVITSTVTVGTGACIGDIDVAVDVTHTFIGDLRITLRSPAGTIVVLHNGSGGSANDIVTLYDDQTNPPSGPGSLADFNGEVAAGAWTLEVSDNAGGDVGSLNSWTLRVGVAGEVCPAEAFDAEYRVSATDATDIDLSCVTPADAITAYTILSLPSQGTLVDPNAGPIASAPYDLVLGGSVVTYDPAPGAGGADGFTFRCFNGSESNIGTVALSVGLPRLIALYDGETDEGWTLEGLWERGAPAGFGQGPSAAVSGSNVFATDLNGPYPNGMSESVYLVAGPFDLSGVSGTELHFQRWLRIHNSAFDDAEIGVSAGGSSFQTVWSHSGGSLLESGWSEQVIDISAVADDEPEVYVRWGIGPTNSLFNFEGWHIDDIAFFGAAPAVVPPGCAGDINGDGSTDLDDFSALAVAFGTAVEPGTGADLSGNGVVDLDDFSALAVDFGCAL